MISRRDSLLGSIALTALAGCVAAPPRPGTPEEVSRLAAALAGLGPNVWRQEARRAAEVTYSYVYQLALEYEIEDSPTVHNAKVNNGTKPRGLCWQWAHDLEERLELERFRTLELHRVVAANKGQYNLEHSIVVMTARGDHYKKGIILDPWRLGGRLTWMRVPEDTDYTWRPRTPAVAEVLSRKYGQPAKIIDDDTIMIGDKVFKPE